jgi:hypothetical protein
MENKERERRVGKAREILNWAIMYLNGRIKCKVVDHKYQIYRVQVFTKEDRLIMPIQIAEEWVKQSNPKRI